MNIWASDNQSLSEPPDYRWRAIQTLKAVPASVIVAKAIVIIIVISNYLSTIVGKHGLIVIPIVDTDTPEKRFLFKHFFFALTPILSVFSIIIRIFAQL